MPKLPAYLTRSPNPPSDPGEIWTPAPMPLSLDYYASSRGRIWNVKRRQLQRAFVDRSGSDKNPRPYNRVTLMVDDKPRKFRVARLVLASFDPSLDLFDESWQANHKNRIDTTNDALENLEAVTQSENIRHARDNGGRRHEKFDREAVEVLRCIWQHVPELPIDDADVCEVFDCSPSQAWRVRHGETWADVEPAPLVESE